MRKLMITTFVMILMFSSTYAAVTSLSQCTTAISGFDALTCIFCGLAGDIQGLLGPIAFLLVVLAAIIYAGGQLGDAQLRAKAQGWAIMAMVGALIAFVLNVVGPTLMKAMFGNACE